MPLSIIDEPDFESDQSAESVLQRAFVCALEKILSSEKITFEIRENFGLDVAVFLNNENRSWIKLFELKAFVGGRPGGIGFGNQQGRGSQVDLLLSESPKIFDPSIRWIMAYGLRPKDTPRYAFFTCAAAKKAAMGGVRRDKQNNLRVKDFENELFTWKELLERTYTFLVT